MSKTLAFFLISFMILSSCSDEKAPAPAIVLKSVVVNQDLSMDYKDKLEKIPVLKAGDEVEVSLYLDGNGSSLNSLNVTSTNPDVEAILIPSENGLIAEDRNFTDLENGRLSFIDGVSGSDVKTRLRIVSVSGNTARLSFHLSARAECEAGGVLNLDFTISN